MSVDTALEKYEGLRERLGKETDTALAKAYGLSRGRIYQFRTTLNIPPLKPKGKGRRVLTFRNLAFAALREEWMETNEGKTVEDLAEQLGTRAARITAWTIGSEGRQPPHDTLVELAWSMGYEIRLRETGLALVRVDPDSRPVPDGEDGTFYQRRPGEKL